MDIRFFGKLGELIGREIRLDPPTDGCTVSELRRLLASLYPDAELDLMSPSLKACIADSFVEEDWPIAAGETVEFLPPLSGG